MDIAWEDQGQPLRSAAIGAVEHLELVPVVALAFDDVVIVDTLVSSKRS